MRPGQKKIRLGVNIDHVATLRQVRGRTTDYPDIVELMKFAIKGGADQITLHLREDRRHIQEEDLARVIKACKVLVNLEMAVTKQMIKFALKYKPDWVCLVPEKREELTTEGGLNVQKKRRQIAKLVETVGKRNIKVSTFIEPNSEQVWASHAAGARAVEFHTGHWVQLRGAKKQREWRRLVGAARLAHKLGLHVHAGHGLDYKATQKVLKLPHLQELNIGHFFVCESLKVGMRQAVYKMAKILRARV